MSEALLQFANELYAETDNLKIINMNKIKKEAKFRKFIHRSCMLLFTRTDFSYQFEKKRNQTTKKAEGISKLLLQVSKFTPKVANEKINMFLTKVAGFNYRNPFETEIVMVGSLNASPELLTAKGQKVITVMESWDHATKQPCGHLTNQFWGWNKDLCDDWAEKQLCDLPCVFHPLKLRYANEVFKKQFLEKKTYQDKSCKTRILYPVASTDKFSIGVLVEIEKKLIQDLIDITEQLAWELVIKPRPNGRNGEFDYATAYSHVSVESVSHGDIVNPANYFYSEDDNKERFSCLENIDLVLNAFTTYGLDAAAAGLPVLQLDLRDATGYENSHLVYNNYHIKKYLLSSKKVFKPINMSLQQALQSYSTQQLVELGKDYQIEMNDWLYEYHSCQEAIDKMINTIFK